MSKTEFTKSDFEHYLEVLHVSKRCPGYTYLEELILSHLIYIPFENISKLYYLKTRNLDKLMNLSQYLNGIEQFHFGGTCYSNNYFFYRLLLYLGFDVKLCGADMKMPDVHIVIIVDLKGKEYLVDVGYAAPFLKPLPSDRNEDFVIQVINNKYVLKPKDNYGRQRLIYFKNDVIFHGYNINPNPRNINEFSEIILKSFLSEATFMNSVLLTKYDGNSFHTIDNLTYIKYNNNNLSEEILTSEKALIDKINLEFNIPDYFVIYAIEDMLVNNVK